MSGECVCATMPVNPCYRARQRIEHPAHKWTNGIEVQYPVRCPGHTSKSAANETSGAGR